MIILTLRNNWNANKVEFFVAYCPECGEKVDLNTRRCTGCNYHMI